ncbi:hypothetical protein [Haliscomenobacter sp.]|uniref:hypothetical protein n=1 Tax=Haliscomenobacter sp. TaxID=2717303 RepID=UPI003365292A
MSLAKKVNLIIYRFRERGLEIFLVNSPDSEEWTIPQKNAEEHSPLKANVDRFIELDPVEPENGATEEAYAVEGEWHDIPSLKSMLFEDAVYLKDKLKNEMDQGTFVAFKEAFKKVMPHQYAFLKELKDILTDRNSVKDL